MSSIVANLHIFMDLFSFDSTIKCKGPCLVKTMAESWNCVVFGQKKHEQATMCELVNCFTINPSLLFVLFHTKMTYVQDNIPFESMNFLQELMIHIEQNFHIWPHLTCAFRSWLFWQLQLRCLGFGFDIITINPYFVTTSPFEQIRIVNNVM